jgi:hypothetical protein
VNVELSFKSWMYGYRKYIVNDQTEEAFKSLSIGELNDEKRKRLDQLIDVVAKIDRAGWRRFRRNLSKKDIQLCKNSLVNAFRAHTDYISYRYNELRNDLGVVTP